MKTTKYNTYNVDVPSAEKMRNVTEQNQFFRAHVELQDAVTKMKNSDVCYVTFQQLSENVKMVLINKGYDVTCTTDRKGHILYYTVSWEYTKEVSDD